MSTCTYFDGQSAFHSLAARIEQTPEPRAHLLLNMPRRYGDPTATDLTAAFAERFWRHDWPSTDRAPDVHCDPRSFELEPGGHGVLHAKAIVIDERAALISSANLTEAAFHRNIEAGILTRDRLIASSLVRHFRTLIDHGHLAALRSP